MPLLHQSGGAGPPKVSDATRPGVLPGEFVCDLCEGTGRFKVIPSEDCAACDGTGWERKYKRYRTIVADPPWEMARGSDYSWREGRPSGERQQLAYGTMTTDEIAAIPVDRWAAVDAHLFVWTTHRHLEATFGIVKAWRFDYVCTLTWCKQPHGWGPGGVFQSTTEFVLYARRGKSGVEGQIDRQWWTWPRGEHSAKPDAFLDMIEAKFPEPRLEMFARRARFGWDYWGDESLGTAELPEAAA